MKIVPGCQNLCCQISRAAYDTHTRALVYWLRLLPTNITGSSPEALAVVPGPAVTCAAFLRLLAFGTSTPVFTGLKRKSLRVENVPCSAAALSHSFLKLAEFRMDLNPLSDTYCTNN